MEGNNTNNNWYQWEHSFDESNVSRIQNEQKSGIAVDHWNRYSNDIDLMRDLGVSHYRFSIEWSRIEPKKGEYDPEAIAHYRTMCEEMVSKNITPVITLHHFTNPIWFEGMGAFEKEENSAYFLKFCEVIFEELSDIVPIWCTFNEPSVYVAQGYFQGIFPPGKKDPVLAGIVLENMLNTHVAVYKKLKSLPNGDKVQIGLVKNIFQFDPSRRWNLVDWIFSILLNDIYTNEPLKYLKTGKSSFYLPGMVDREISNPDAVKSLDFIGLNYYARLFVKGRIGSKEPFELVQREGDVLTDMGWPVYPEGFYKALKKVNELGLPIYVTENGIADESDKIRPMFIKKYLYAMDKAMSERIDVRGYFYWSLMDNFEWAEGYDGKFGLYNVDRVTLERNLREGSKAFIEIVNKKGADERGYIVSVGDKAPDFEIKYTTGELESLSNLQGKVVILQFTASWCSVCRMEMPHLEKDIWQTYKNKNVHLIGIDRGEPIETVKRFKKQMKITYPLALDIDEKIFELYADRNAGVTRNIVIDQNGNIVFLTRLFEEQEYNEMLEVIKSLL